MKEQELLLKELALMLERQDMPFQIDGEPVPG